MSTSFLRSAGIAIVGLTLSALANAQGREPGGEAGIDVIYQNSTTLKFTGGTRVDLDDDVGLSVSFGYRFNARLEMQFLLDWTNVDYHARLVRDTGAVTSTNGTMESFTPRINLNINLLKTAFTPYVTGGVGYAFIDTNIPTGRPQTGCWWDPWYGYVCTTVQNTKTVDDFVYQVGAGLRWDFSDTGTLRLVYERHWIDGLNTASEKPYADQVKLGFVFRY
jgi:opacity protein-like surface antigen